MYKTFLTIKYMIRILYLYSIHTYEKHGVYNKAYIYKTMHGNTSYN